MKFFKAQTNVDFFKYLDNACCLVAYSYVHTSKTTVDNASRLRKYEVQLELWELLRDVSESMSLHPNLNELRGDLQFIAAELHGGYADKIVKIFEVDLNRIAPPLPLKTISSFQEMMRESLPVGRNIQEIRESGDIELAIGICFLADKETKDFNVLSQSELVLDLITQNELVLVDALSFSLIHLLAQASNSPKKEMHHEWQAAIVIISMIIGMYFSKKLDLK